MLIGILSDTHEQMLFMKKAVERFNSAGVDLVLHAGDIISPICAGVLSGLRMRMVGVFGNNDGEKDLWRQRITPWGELHGESFEAEYERKKLILMHEPRWVDALAASQCFDVIVYGHTHKVDNRVVGKTLIINPGECGALLTGKSTVALLRLPEKDVSILELLP